MSGGAAARRRTGPLVPALLGVLAFLPALSIGFFRDDFGWVEGALRGTRDFGWVFEPAKTDFRPIPKLSVLLNLAMFGIDPRGYALFNVLVHAANVALLWGLARRLTGDRRAAFVAATLFAVGTWHYGEAVYWMSGRTGLLADLWSLAALLCYDRWICNGPRRDGLLAFMFFGLALLTKESTAVLPVALVALEWIRGSRARVPAAARRLAPYFALAAVYVFLEFAVLRADSPVVGGAFALGPHVVRNFGEYFARMLLPLTPSSMLVTAPPALVPVLAVTSSVLMVAAPLAVIALALARGAPRAARFGAIGAMIAILPYLALTFRTTTRYLYGPSQGIAIAVAALSLAVLDRAERSSPAAGRRARTAGAIALLLLVVAQCVILGVAMERRRSQQVAESGPAQARLEQLAREAGVRVRESQTP